MSTFKYRGYHCETVTIHVPGGNDLHAVKVLGTNIKAEWPIAKAAIDKAAA